MASKKLEALEKQREQLEARIKKLKADNKAKERKEDTRRKVLLGALVSEMMEKDTELKSRVFGELRKWLTRKSDRALFGFEPLPENDTKKD